MTERAAESEPPVLDRVFVVPDGWPERAARAATINLVLSLPSKIAWLAVAAVGVLAAIRVVSPWWLLPLVALLVANQVSGYVRTLLAVRRAAPPGSTVGAVLGHASFSYVRSGRSTEFRFDEIAAARVVGDVVVLRKRESPTPWVIPAELVPERVIL